MAWSGLWIFCGFLPVFLGSRSFTGLRKMTDLVRLVAEKNKQRAALKKEYWKQLTNPEAGGTGVVFDPGFQRLQAMRVTRVDHFRETPKNLALVMVLIVIPCAATIWMIKNDRDKKEALYRSGKVAYKDRLFKLQ